MTLCVYNLSNSYFTDIIESHVIRMLRTHVLLDLASNLMHYSNHNCRYVCNMKNSTKYKLCT